MRIKVLSGGRKNIELSLSDAELNFQMRRIGIEETVPMCRLVEVSEKDNPLHRFEGQTVNMDEVNFFAKRMESLTEYERKVLSAYAEDYGVATMKDLINLTFSMKGLSLLTDFSDARQVGVRLYMDEFLGMSEEEKEQTNFIEFAEKTLKESRVEVLPYGVFVEHNQVRGGMLRKKLTSLTHKNLPLAMFLETSDLGYPAWGGGKNQKVSDDEIIGSLGLGIVRFNEVVTPEVIAADYEYRVDTDVVTTVTISGGQSDPDHPVSVTFSILGRNYTVNNVYYPEDGQQLVWVKWHTPSTEQYITINVSVSGGGSASKGTITANIVDLDKNPPPNPVADDRNDSYNAGNAIIPANPQKTSASWSVWRPWWKEKWVWHSDWKWKTGSHTEECEEDCENSHGYWEDEGEYMDEGWWEFSLDRYSASLSATMDLTTDAKSPTATATTIKSGYGVNISVNASASTGQSSATTPPQTAVSYFPEFYYKTYWRLLDRTRSGYHAGFEFRNNHFSTYNRRTHFTPVWMPNGTYTVYTYLLDCWTPDGMLSVNLTDSVQISGDLWDDWHIAPQRAR